MKLLSYGRHISEILTELKPVMETVLTEIKGLGH